MKTSFINTQTLCGPAAVALVLLSNLILAPVSDAQEQHEQPAQFVDDLHAAFGNHHVRAVHAKGIILEGSFTPTEAAAALSKASIFSSGPIVVTARFSDFTGIPDIPDTAALANPRGFALKFQPKNGADVNLVTHSFNGFPVSTADEFGKLLRAIAASGPEAKKPTELDQFLGSHPIAKTFLTTQKPAPESYATLSYFGVNSFKFISPQEKSTVVRYRLIPVGGEKLLSAEALKSKAPNYLSDEIKSRVANGAIKFDWYAQIAEANDKIADPSIAWPEQHKLVKLGTVTIDRLVSDQAAADKKLLFLPGQVPPGIETADPMLQVRTGAYPVSFGQRQ
jgi:catalase